MTVSYTAIHHSPPSFYTRNGLVALKPLKDRKPDMAVKSAFGVVASRTDLLEFEVAFPTYATLECQSKNLCVSPGQRVYVMGDALAHDWAKKVHKHEDQEFLLVPEQFILAVKTS